MAVSRSAGSCAAKPAGSRRKAAATVSAVSALVSRRAARRGRGSRRRCEEVGCRSANMVAQVPPSDSAGDRPGRTGGSVPKVARTAAGRRRSGRSRRAKRAVDALGLAGGRAVMSGMTSTGATPPCCAARRRPWPRPARPRPSRWGRRRAVQQQTTGSGAWLRATRAGGRYSLRRLGTKPRSARDGRGTSVPCPGAAPARARTRARTSSGAAACQRSPGRPEVAVAGVHADAGAGEQGHDGQQTRGRSGT